MSNFMHKVKDAMTDHDNKDTARGFMTSHDGQGSTNAPATESGLNQNRSSGVGSNNPYGSDIRPSDGPAAYREPKFQGTNQSSADPTSTGMGNQGRSNDYGTTAMRGDRSTNPTNANAGPHDSKMANKMDPRVDSDMGKRSQPPKPQGQADGIDNRATDTNVGPHGSKLANKMDPRVDSDMDNRATQGAMRAPGNMSSGVDNHETSEDDYNKSTQETNSQSQPQPGMYDNNQMTSEESHTTSTQEHKSHSATSHTVPCQTNMQNEQGLGNSGLDSSGLGSRAQPAFGGNAAAGGSSYSSGARQPSGIQNDDPLNKLDPRANRSNEQANVGNQRGVY